MEPQKRTTTICTRTRITRLALTHQSPPCTLYITGQSIDNIDIIINTSYTTLTINQNNIKLRIPHTRTFIIHTAQYNAIRRDQADPFNSIKQKRTSQRTGPCLSGRNRLPTIKGLTVPKFNLRGVININFNIVWCSVFDRDFIIKISILTTTLSVRLFTATQATNIMTSLTTLLW